MEESEPAETCKNIDLCIPITRSSPLNKLNRWNRHNWEISIITPHWVHLIMINIYLYSSVHILHKQKSLVRLSEKNHYIMIVIIEIITHCELWGRATDLRVIIPPKPNLRFWLPLLLFFGMAVLQWFLLNHVKQGLRASKTKFYHTSRKYLPSICRLFTMLSAFELSKDPCNTEFEEFECVLIWHHAIASMSRQAEK